MKIRVLSYNIHKGFSTSGWSFILHQLKQALRETQADILFLQEVVGENKRHQQNLKDWPNQPQFEFLADTTWPHYAYGKNAVFSERNHGNAILSRFPIQQNQNLDISNHKLEQRGLLHCQILIPELNKYLDLFNTHIDLLSSGRKKQGQKISQFLNQNIDVKNPFLLAGDFNDWPRELNSYFHETTQAQEVFVQVHGHPARSFPSFLPLLTLDRIYFRGLRAQSAEVLSTPPWSRLSDHLPLLAEFDFN